MIPAFAKIHARYSCVPFFVSAPPLFTLHPRPHPSWSPRACKINTRSRHETPRNDIPARVRGLCSGKCMAFSCARDGGLFCKRLYRRLCWAISTGETGAHFANTCVGGCVGLFQFVQAQKGSIYFTELAEGVEYGNGAGLALPQARREPPELVGYERVHPERRVRQLYDI